MNPSEFSKRIKEKYPQYQDIDDVELAKKIIAKYPVYASQVNFEATPEVVVPEKKEPGFIERTKEALIGEKRQERVKEILDSDQGKLSTTYQLGGEVIRGAFDAFAEVPGVKQGLETLATLIKKGSETSPIKAAGEAIEPLVTKAVEKYEGLSDEQKRNVDATIEYLTVLPAEKLAKMGIDVGLKGVAEGIKGGQKIVRETGKIAQDVANVASKTKTKITELAGDKAKLRSYFSNLDENVFKRVENPQHAQRVKSAMEVLESGNRNPYHELAHNIGEKIVSLRNDAKAAYHEAAQSYVAKGDTFDVGARLDEIMKSVSSFKAGKDIKYEQIRKSDGTLGEYKLTKGQYSPFSGDEIGKLNGLINDISSARAVNADQLLALDQKFATYYRAVSDAAGPTPYHAAVMELKDATQDRIRALLSGELKNAYTQYAKVSDLATDFGNRIISNDGYIKDTAEQFLANTTNINKGALQGKIKEYSDLLGIDVINESQAIADAKKFMLTSAPSSGRTKDVLMGLGFAGIGSGIGTAVLPGWGSAIGAAMGAGVGQKLTSPNFLGKRAIEETLGKTSQTTPARLIEK